MADTNSTLINMCNDIASALQTKLQTTSTFKPVDFAGKISDIGSDIRSEAKATASDVKRGKKAYVGDGYINGTFTGVDLIVTLSDEEQTLTPESGQYYKKVIVPAGASEVWDGTGIVVTTLPKLTTPVIELTVRQSSFALKVSDKGFASCTMAITVTDDAGESSPTTYQLNKDQETAILFTGNAATVLIKLTSHASKTDVMVKKNNTSVYTFTDSGQTSISVVNGDIIEIINNSTCFPAGTPVLMADGSQKLIETIEVGDKVKSFDLDTQEYGEAEVTEVVTGYTNRMAMLLFSDNSYVAMAEGHPLYTTDGWKSINKEGYPVLQVGDKVLGANGYVEIIDLQVVDCEPTIVYSLSISSQTAEKKKFYFAGNWVALAHS